jgi:hypothetical protein
VRRALAIVTMRLEKVGGTADKKRKLDGWSVCCNASRQLPSAA